MVLRQPWPAEYAQLDDLYLRSKAVWGYARVPASMGASAANLSGKSRARRRDCRGN